MTSTKHPSPDLPPTALSMPPPTSAQNSSISHPVAPTVSMDVPRSIESHNNPILTFTTETSPSPKSATTVSPHAINNSESSKSTTTVSSHAVNNSDARLTTSPDDTIPSTASTPMSTGGYSSNSTLSTSSLKTIKSSKRSSSSSNDLIYERDRFRARLHTFNKPTCDDPSLPFNKICEICDEIGSKTTKLNIVPHDDHIKDPASSSKLYSLNESLSPLDANSRFYSHLPSLPGPTHLDLPIKLISANSITSIFHWYFNKELPPTTKMFPWLHGLHEENFAQKSFFLCQQQVQRQAQRQARASTPPHSFPITESLHNKPADVRFLMCIDASAHLSNNNATTTKVLKNSISIGEVLTKIQTSKSEVMDLIESIIHSIFPQHESPQTLINTIISDCFKLGFVPVFINLDPEKGVSLRNFHIQVAKSALCSDFIVYSNDNDVNRHLTTQLKQSLARLLMVAQKHYDHDSQNTVFILDNIEPVEQKALVIEPNNEIFQLCLESNKKTQLDIISQHIESNTLFIWDNDYQFKEKIETTRMSSATPIGSRTWAGNIWDHQVSQFYHSEHKPVDQADPTSLKNLFCNPANSIITRDIHDTSDNVLSYLSAPRATWNLFVYCHKDGGFPDSNKLSQLLNGLFHPYYSSQDSHQQQHQCHTLNFPPSGSIGMGNLKKENLMAIVNTCKLLYLYQSISPEHNSLIYCSDGYTESSLLVICFLMYSHHIPLDEALLKLHIELGRPFYIFNSDVTILKKLQVILHKLSPANPQFKRDADWKSNLDNLTTVEINSLLLSPANSTSSISKNLRLGYIANDSDDEEDSSAESDSSDYDTSSSDDSDDDNVGFKTATKKNTISSRSQHEQKPRVPGYLSGDWVSDVEGSIPSMVLPHLYLGSLKHANSLPLLSKLGITKVISVGECLDWLHDYKFQNNNDIIIDEIDNGNIELYNIEPNPRKLKHGKKAGASPVSTVLKINNLQDDGIDELTHTLPYILQYIDEELVKSHGQARILIHCRVGVSRSATVCIAEVMKKLGLSLPKAYLYVRVRRLNIVIQPNLRFMYELFKWEEREKSKLRNDDESEFQGSSPWEASDSPLREIDWFVMCREITKLNIPYLTN